MESQGQATQKEKKSLVINMIIKFGFIYLFIWLLLILPAGTWRYWEVYVYFGILFLMIASFLPYFLKHDPAFLKRRLQFVEKDKQQKVMQFYALIFYLGVFPLCALDKRFGWSSIPLVLIVFMDLIVMTGYLIIFTVFKQNSYASRIIQVEKGQTLITTGLYGIVRHPMYFGALILYMATPIALGSYWGLLLMLFLPVYIVLRLLNEERLLMKDLPGYREYCRQVRYHLIPYIW